MDILASDMIDTQARIDWKFQRFQQILMPLSRNDTEDVKILYCKIQVQVWYASFFIHDWPDENLSAVIKLWSLINTKCWGFFVKKCVLIAINTEQRWHSTCSSCGYVSYIYNTIIRNIWTGHFFFCYSILNSPQHVECIVLYEVQYMYQYLIVWW